MPRNHPAPPSRTGPSRGRGLAVDDAPQRFEPPSGGFFVPEELPMKPGLHDFAVQRGGSGEIAIRLLTADDSGVRTPLDLTGSSFVLNVVWPEGGLRKASGDAGLSVDIATAEIAWRPSPAESRLVPEGRIARYEWERRDASGRQAILLTGFMIGEGGLNDD
jgi:hypothetical protein